MTALPFPFRSGRAAALAAGCLLLAGCVPGPAPSSEPQPIAKEEIALPPAPRRALTVGVYSCIDTSGQRRPTGQPQELSTAVPMDCTPYLMEAVRALSPGYLNLVERQHVDELLRERQIATLALNAGNGSTNGNGNGNGNGHANGKPNGNGAPPRQLAALRVAEVLFIGQVVA